MFMWRQVGRSGWFRKYVAGPRRSNAWCWEAARRALNAGWAGSFTKHAMPQPAERRLAEFSSVGLPYRGYVSETLGLPVPP